MCVTSKKASRSSGFFVSHRHLLFALSATRQQGNLAFRTTRVDDTHLTLAANPFWVGVNNSFFAVTDIREKVCRVPVPVRFIIPWPLQRNYRLYRTVNSETFFACLFYLYLIWNSCSVLGMCLLRLSTHMLN